MSKWITTIRTAALLLGLAAWATPASAAPTMKQVIENVEANEQLYRNIEMVVTETYRLADDAEIYQSRLIRTTSKRRRMIRQGKFLYLKENRNEDQVNGESYEPETTSGYDGEMTRRVQDVKKKAKGVAEQSKLANLTHGRVEEPQIITPHRWLVAHAFVSFPLSLYLRGSPALEKDPRVHTLYRENLVDVTVAGGEKFDGMDCVKIRIDMFVRRPKKTLLNVRYLWLATDRNYLPVHQEEFYPRQTMKVANGIGVTWDWREIAPGVWLPFKRKMTYFDGDKLRDGDKQVIRNENEATVEKVKLDPDYDISLFRDIPIPDGALVYEVRDNKIVHSYQKGADKPDPEVVGHARRGWWLWLLVPGVLAVVLAGWWWRRRRGRLAVA
jgi:hypothetical protein